MAKNKKFKEIFWLSPLLYSLILILIILSLVNVTQFFLKPLEVKEIDVKFEISNSTGFDLNKSLLTFGRLSYGNSMVREVNIINEYDFPIKITILITKEINNFVFSESEYFLDLNESVLIPFTATVPENAEFGNYTGKVKFEIRKKYKDN